MNATLRRCALLLLLFVPMLLPGLASAQAYPSKPIHIFVPYPPGGNADVQARVVGGKISQLLHVPVIVDNHPGAGSLIAMGLLARSAPNGYTILINTIGQAIIPSLYHHLSFDPIKDFAPVTEVSKTTLVMVASKHCPARTIKQLIALAKSEPGKLNYGATGVGGILHLSMERFRLQTGTKMAYIPYRGTARVVQALLVGQVDVAITPLTAALPHIKAGKLFALAVTGAHRSAAIPNVPTVSQAGVPGYVATSWQGFFVQGKTPPAIVHKLQRATARALHSPDVRKHLARLGDRIVGSTPEQFEATLASDRREFAKLVKAAHIKVQH